MLQIRKSEKGSIGRFPVEWSHGEVVVISLSDSKPILEIREAIELAAGIEFLVVFSVTAFYFAIVSGRVWTDQLVVDAELIQCLLKQRRLWIFAVGQTIGEFKSIICLDARNGIGEFLYHILQKLCRGIGALLFVRLENAETAVLINEGVLKIRFFRRFTDQAGFRNIFNVNLAFLSRISHLLIRFRHLFRVWQFDGLPTDPAKDTVQAGDGSGIAALGQLDPEHHQTGVRIPAAHILDEFDLIFCVLIGMAVRAMGAVCQGAHRTVILLAPAVDILSGCLVADRCLCYSVLERILNYHLLKPHVLCYLIHSE